MLKNVFFWLLLLICLLNAAHGEGNILHNETSCHLLLPEHCHCRTALNYTTAAQKNACKCKHHFNYFSPFLKLIFIIDFYPIAFLFLGAALVLMVVQLIVIFCIFSPALKRRSVTYALLPEEVRCEHCDQTLELLMHQVSIIKYYYSYNFLYLGI